MRIRIVKENNEIDQLLSIINTKKAGPEYKKALMALINLAKKKTGREIFSKKDALQALDYEEPRIREAITTDISSIVKDTLGPKVTVRPFKNNMIVVAPDGFFSSSRLQQMANDLNERIPESWLESPISVGTGGVTEGLLIIRLNDEGKKHTNLIREEENFTPIEDPKEPKPAAKQFQILASMITNTKVNDQTNILSAMRALPGVTIVNSQAATPGANSEGQLRYQTNVDIKIDTSALEGDIKAAIKKIVEDIKQIDGVVEFKILPKAKETTPY